MSKTELRQRPHHIISGATVFELWYNGQLIGEVAGADGPGVNVISQYLLTSTYYPAFPNVVVVKMGDR